MNGYGHCIGKRACGAPRKHQILRFSVCGSPASIKFFVLAFAGVPQASNFPFWRLREPRKHQILRFGVCGLPRKHQIFRFGVCGNPASIKFSVLAFAGIPQVPRRSGWYLREPRKCHGEAVGICGNPANATEKRLVFAGIPQALKLQDLAFTAFLLAALRWLMRRRNLHLEHMP